MMHLQVPKGYMERFLVKDPSEKEDEQAPPPNAYQLTPRQRIAVYMCGIRPAEVKTTHASAEQGSAYVRQCMQTRDSFAAKYKNTEKICPGMAHVRSTLQPCTLTVYLPLITSSTQCYAGHALDIIDYLSDEYGFKHDKITTDSQVQKFYKELKDRFNLKPDYLQACKLYAYGLPPEFIFKITTPKLVEECVEETSKSFQQDNPRRDTTIIPPDSQFQSIRATFADEPVRSDEEEDNQFTVTPQKRKHNRRTVL